MLCGTAHARVIEVGPSRALLVPSQAALVAQNGDTVRIDAGTYVDCAVWHASRLTIEGMGTGVTLARKVCQQKGIFVIAGNDVRVRNLTFQGATNAEHNAAGIRQEGANLTVENSHFLNNENGILAGGGANSTVRIMGSSFVGNGACIGACAHGVYAGAPIGLLDIDRSTFLRTHAGHHIKSRALKTQVRNCRIEDGPDGSSSYLIDIPQGGDVLIEGNTMEKGPRSENRATAISIGAEEVSNPTHSLVVRGNRFHSDVPARTTFVRNYTHERVEMRDNRIEGNVEPVGGPLP